MLTIVTEGRVKGGTHPIIMLWNGNPERAQMARDWRRVA